MAGEHYLGVDWSSGSWLAVVFGREGFDHAAVYEEIGRLWSSYEETAARVFVDMPVGLVEDGDAVRECDRLARATLGSRRSSVFVPPVREATRKRRYPAAKRVNERRADRSISKQAFAISDGIAAVDELLQNVPEARTAFRESHPEVCFRAFAGEPLEYSKQTAGGYAERMRTLAAFDVDAAPTVQRVAAATGGERVAVDDVLDAVVLAYTARPGPGDLRTLPPDPPTDSEGLPMEMVYRAPEPLEPDGSGSPAE
jgi:predicted RNase H-like nuclease